MSLDEAAALCSGLITAVLAFYNRHQVATHQSLGLMPFWEEGGRGKYAGQPIVIFGGASSLGQYGAFMTRPLKQTAQAFLVKLSRLPVFQVSHP